MRRFACLCKWSVQVVCASGLIKESAAKGALQGPRWGQSKFQAQSQRPAPDAQAIKRELLGTWAIKKAIWSAKMRRLRKMKSSHRLGT